MFLGYYGLPTVATLPQHGLVVMVVLLRGRARRAGARHDASQKNSGLNNFGKDRLFRRHILLIQHISKGASARTCMQP